MQKDRTSSHLYVSIRRPKVLEKIHLDVSNVSNLREQYIPADLVLYTMWLGGEAWFLNRRHWARRAVFDMWCECDINLIAVAHLASAIVRKGCMVAFITMFSGYRHICMHWSCLKRTDDDAPGTRPRVSNCVMAVNIHHLGTMDKSHEAAEPLSHRSRRTMVPIR